MKSRRSCAVVPLQSVPAGILFAITIGSFALFVGAMLYVYAWIYRDAKANSSHPAVAWVAVSILFPVIGVILYFLIGRGDPTGHHDGLGHGR
jgi:lipid-A-disaccharide synthase-like uncharacterized protein